MAKMKPKHYEFGTCLFCSKVFNLKENLLSHVRVHIHEKHLFCSHCGYEATQFSSMKYHLKTQHSSGKYVVTKDYKCPLCPKFFEFPSNVQIYVVVHTRETPFQCSLCGRRFSNKCNSNRHIKTHQSTNKVKTMYECSLCGKHISSKRGLSDHILIAHRDTKNHKCEICGKCFGRIHGLKTHLFQRTGERLYNCNHCDKTFTSLRVKKRHEKQHLNELHKCDICGKDGIKNISKHILQTHRVHKQYSCIFCGKEYKHRISLDYHILGNIHEKAEECKLCGKQCKGFGNLQKHHRSIHSKYEGAPVQSIVDIRTIT